MSSLRHEDVVPARHTAARQPALAAVLGLVLLSLAFVVYHLFDFKIFWEAGKNLLDGERIYPSQAELDLATRTYFVYPPVVAVAFVPFSLLPLVVAGALYSLLALLATGMTLRVLGIEDKRCYIALLFWMPVLQGVGLGTIAPFLALALAIAWKYRHSALTMPLVLSVAVVAKLFLWPLLFWLVATRRWRAAALSGLATAVLVLVPWALLGFRDFDWYPHALRLLLDHEQQLGFSASTALGPLHANVVAPAIQLGAVLAIFFLARQEDGDRRSFSAAVICALLLSPLVWIHYFVVLVVPIALASRRFGWMWVLPAAAFWPPPNNLHHPWIASCVFCVFAVAGGLTLLPGARIRRLGSAWPGRYGPTVHGDPDSVRPSLSG